MMVLIYVCGVITGAGLMLVHFWQVRKAVNAERAKYLKRIEQLDCERRTADCADAYRRGVKEGREGAILADLKSTWQN